ncbi:hypothetical protein [Flavobacterium chilense]|uniref:Tail fiber protein n=1 Tax=Flavobacterium chilense TaxID=946677 RepID=A0A1M7ESI2_9FLAO|nr:hypothetical protein [Flavobacterium chilense]SHL94721.1 hypothetical protein SAMN05444484_10357 [Flavobacterium chilense]
MDTNHNRIKVVDLEINEPNKILTTNNSGELEFNDINNIKIDSYNALDYIVSGKALDARQGKVLKDLIDDVNELLASDNVDLNTLQKLGDTIEVIRNSLNILLVNDLSTGGTTKALTAEMGKILQNSKVDKITGKSLLSDTEITRLGTLSNYVHPVNHPANIITQDSSNRFVSDTEKSSWNSKAEVISPTFTGVPAAPTAAAGTNTSQLATTAFVRNATSAASNNSVLLSGDQAKRGILSFDNGPNPSLINGIRTNSGANTFSIGAIFDAEGGTAVSTTVAIAATGYKIETEGFNGILINSKSIYPGSSGIKLNGATGSTAMLFKGQNNGIDTYTLNKTGDIVANTFTGGATLIGIPTAPTAPTGTNTSQIATTAFVQNIARPYKVYTALLSQSGTNAPIATVLENTLGGLPVWSRNSIGLYIANLSGVFTTNKTVFFITGSFGGIVTNGARTSENECTITTVKSDTSVYTDGVMYGTTIEIRVYN